MQCPHHACNDSACPIRFYLLSLCIRVLRSCYSLHAIMCRSVHLRCSSVLGDVNGFSIHSAQRRGDGALSHIMQPDHGHNKAKYFDRSIFFGRLAGPSEASPSGTFGGRGRATFCILIDVPEYLNAYTRDKTVISSQSLFHVRTPWPINGHSEDNSACLVRKRSRTKST